MGIRHTIKRLSPTTLQDGVAERFLYGMALLMDGIVEKACQGAHSRMPLRADPTVLPYLGQERLIPKGLTEGDASYALRLQGAIDDWRTLAGSAWGVMKQVRGYLLAKAPRIRSVWAIYPTTGIASAPTHSVWSSFAIDSAVNVAPDRLLVSGPGNWEWDRYSPTTGSWGPWRWWLVIFSVGGGGGIWCTQAPFAFGTAGVKIGQRPDASIGLGVAPAVVESIRSIVGLWQRAGSWCQWIIISFSGSLFDPDQPSGGGINPDGYYGRWSKIDSGEYVRARSLGARYCDGIA